MAAADESTNVIAINKDPKHAYYKCPTTTC